MSDDVEGAELVAQVVDYYHRTLLESPEAQEYLDEARHLRPGGGEALQARLRQPHSRAEAAGEEPRRRREDARAAAEAGIIRASGHEHLERLPS